jgi:hypothetical protein
VLQPLPACDSRQGAKERNTCIPIKRPITGWCM